MRRSATGRLRKTARRVFREECELVFLLHRRGAKDVRECCDDTTDDQKWQREQEDADRCNHRYVTCSIRLRGRIDKKRPALGLQRELASRAASDHAVTFCRVIGET